LERSVAKASASREDSGILSSHNPWDLSHSRFAFCSIRNLGEILYPDFHACVLTHALHSRLTDPSPCSLVIYVSEL
jgi:hypothetical protein